MAAALHNPDGKPAADLSCFSKVLLLLGGSDINIKLQSLKFLGRQAWKGGFGRAGLEGRVLLMRYQQDRSHTG